MDPVKALLLENIHPDAVAALEGRRHRGQPRVTGALDEAELIAALDGVELLGIRSRTKVTRRRCSPARPTCWRSARSASAPTRSTWPPRPDRAIAVFNAPFSNTRSVVELAIAEMISLTRRLTEKNDALHARRLGQVGQGRPRDARPHARHRRLRQHRQPALGAGRGARHGRRLLRHRRQAAAGQRPQARHPRRAARAGRRRHAARRRTGRQRGPLRRQAVRRDAPRRDLPQPLARLRRRPGSVAGQHPQRPPGRRGHRRLPGRAEGPGRRRSSRSCAACPT